jgi:drug/metabolite transporter (DMT)-like permease
MLALSDNTLRHLWPGVPFALGAAIFFGASTPLSKFLLGSIDPWMLVGILYLAAGLGLLAVKIIRKGLRQETAEAALTTGDYPWLAAVVIAGGLIGPLLLMFGLSRTTAGQTSLLLTLEGLATMGIAWLAFRENVDRRLLAGAAAILAGAAVLAWEGTGLSFDMGSLLIAGACLAWGIDNNLTRKISSADPVQIAMIKGLFAGVTNMTLAFSLGAAVPSPGLLAAGGVVGFFGIGVSLVMFMLALRHLGTARTGAYFSLAPFIGVLLAIMLLQEPVTARLLIAGALMAIGLAIHLAERHEHVHVHEELEHDHLHTHDEHHAHSHGSEVTEPHSHRHRHEPLRHQHPHYPDLHHRHGHG